MIEHFHDDEAFSELLKVRHCLPYNIRNRLNIFVILYENEGEVSKTVHKVYYLEGPFLHTL